MNVQATATLDYVEPGDRSASFLFLKVTGGQAPREGVRMPVGGPYLDALTLERIGLWIDQLEP